MKKIIALSLVAFLSTALSAEATDDTQAQIDKLTKEVEKLKKDQKRTKKTLNKVKAHDAYDNIKFGVDFRNAVDVLKYKDNKTGKTASNDSLFTSRLFLTMKSAPMDGLMFMGKLAIYSTWGAHIYDHSTGLKDWSASSKANDTVMRIKEAYFAYSNEIGSQPWSVSIGRRPSTNGFLANYRENEPKAGSPLAHITNMEVNAAMLKLGWDRFVEGSYSKFVYGRAHTGDTTGVYGYGDGENDGNADMWGPYATGDHNNGDDKDVDFFVFLGDGYNNGQYQVMYEWAHIFNTKGARANDITTKKAAAGTADLLSVGLKIDGIGEEISDFLDETTLFISGAYTTYTAKDGYQILGNAGGTESGSSIWAGVIIPDMITDAGKFGLEYNQGSQYWTPMTWAEDTAIGSKIAVRGSAYEAYWNFNLFGVKYLPSQIRYTYAQHDYTPNVKCAGWVKPVEVDITAQDLRFAVSYRY
ncbi:MAG: DUF3373 family protein [Campylobacterota bacterium]|nr:DUF3373 family protein [Campylobacterota bacterium]